MVALLVARQDGENYGQLMVIDFKGKLVYGPAQVEARISNDPVISSQLTLWSQAGSQVIRGNLLIVPIGQSVMYFEPVYLQAERSPLPELTRVIVAYGDEIVMEPTLTDALLRIFGPAVSPGTTTTRPPGTPTPLPMQPQPCRARPHLPSPVRPPLPGLPGTATTVGGPDYSQWPYDDCEWPDDPTADRCG